MPVKPEDSKRIPPKFKGPLMMEIEEGIQVTLFPKMKKGQPSVDILELNVTSLENETFTLAMTPAEALDISQALQSAVQMYLFNQKQYRTEVLVPQKRYVEKFEKSLKK